MKSKRGALARLVSRVTLACGFIAGIGMLLMMVAGTADIVSSNLDTIGLQSRPVPAAFEFMATMMVVVVFMAIPLAQARRNHIQVELGLTLMPPMLRKACEVLHHGLTAALFGAIAWFAWQAGLHSFRVGEFAAGLINYPIWPARLTLAWGASLMTVQAMLDLAAVFSDRFAADGQPSGPKAGPS